MNLWVGIGNLTRDPEVRYTPGGTAVCELGLAINERKKVGDSWEDVPVFVDVTLWERSAEVAGEYLAKGSKVAIEGKLKLDQWTDRETGQKRQKLKIEGHRLEMLSSKRDQPTGQQRTDDRPTTTETNSHIPDDEVPF